MPKEGCPKERWKCSDESGMLNYTEVDSHDLLVWRPLPRFNECRVAGISAGGGARGMGQGELSYHATAL
jgi:hypothetical protein